MVWKLNCSVTTHAATPELGVSAAIDAAKVICELEM